jgi:hypothetical protein
MGAETVYGPNTRSLLVVESLKGWPAIVGRAASEEIQKRHVGQQACEVIYKDGTSVCARVGALGAMEGVGPQVYWHPRGRDLLYLQVPLVEQDCCHLQVCNLPVYPTHMWVGQRGKRV